MAAFEAQLRRQLPKLGFMRADKPVESSPLAGLGFAKQEPRTTVRTNLFDLLRRSDVSISELLDRVNASTISDRPQAIEECTDGLRERFSRSVDCSGFVKKLVRGGRKSMALNTLAAATNDLISSSESAIVVENAARALEIMARGLADGGEVYLAMKDTLMENAYDAGDLAGASQPSSSVRAAAVRVLAALYIEGDSRSRRKLELQTRPYMSPDDRILFDERTAKTRQVVEHKEPDELAA